MIAVGSALCAATAAAEDTDAAVGQQIYQRLCVSCHGEDGAGTADYPQPLVGTQSVAELASFISQSMPEGNPELCMGEDAAQVAAYIYDAFYSPLAQARIAPARIELSRLTVRQYRQSLADLIAAFGRRADPLDARRGLRAEYFNARSFRNKDRIIERIDPQINFDFKQTEWPTEMDNVAANRVSIRWEGGLLATETGEHQFIIRTDHAARLWVNDLREPLIDAWVKSGDDNEFSASLPLLEGRVYPIRLEFSSAKQGVDDSDQNKNQLLPDNVTVSLHWQRPHRTVELIPERHLAPGNFAASFVSTASFPPDDSSIGYERGTTISRAWEEATTDGAIEAANYVIARLNRLADVRDDAEDRPERLKHFCRKFVERAFRRPLNDELAEFYIERQFAEADSPDAAVKRILLLTLKSPRFLYCELDDQSSEQPDSYVVASRLSFGLWDSLPDAALLEAAAANQLVSREQIEAQVRRMLNDPRTRAKMREFLLSWLKVDSYPDLEKDSALFPGFDETVAADLRTSLELMLDEIVWSDESDYRQLLLTDKLMLNGRLAALYGYDLPPDAPFQWVSSPATSRAGVLTHPYILASFAYRESSSPIHRGVLIARNLLGRALRPPPEAFTPIPAQLHPDLTTRERVILQTTPESCAQCHDMINPLGFTLESYDAIGRYRDQENGQEIDTSGSYLARSGELVRFSNARELSEYLASSEEAHAALVERLFVHLVKQPVRAFGPTTLSQLQQVFAERQYSIRDLVVEVMVCAALRS